MLGVNPPRQRLDLTGIKMIDAQGGPGGPAAAISSPVSSMVSGRPISEGPLTRLLRPVA